MSKSVELMTLSMGFKIMSEFGSKVVGFNLSEYCASLDQLPCDATPMMDIR